MTRKEFDSLEPVAMGGVPISNSQRGQAKVGSALVFLIVFREFLQAAVGL